MSKGGKVNDDILAALAGPKPAPAAAPAKPPRQKATKAVQAKVAAPAAPSATPEAVSAASGRHSSREGKKQISGFLDRATLEIMATLRVRLDMDNSELITFALEELYRMHDAKRKFGDA